MEDVTPPIPSDRMVIDSYGPGRFKVSGEAHIGSILVLPHEVRDFAVPGFDALTLESFAALDAVDDGVEILLIGCGARMQLLPVDIREGLKARGFSVDFMETGAACRTYNILLSEGRAVAAALIAMPGEG